MKNIYAVVLILILASCSKSYDLGDKSADAIPVDTANPTWDNGVGAVIQAKCVNCHTPAAKRSQFVPGNTPSTIDDISSESFFADAAKASLVQGRVFNDTATPMPPKFATPLTADERSALSTWIGTKTISITTICGSTGSSAWTFTDASAVLNSGCGGCHSSAPRVAFTSIATVRSYRSTMLQYLNQGSMPPSNPTYKASGNGALLFNWLCFGSEVQ